jgi:enterochelin esterase-like enzyme
VHKINCWSVRLVAFIGLFFTSSVQANEPEMVRPESLSQGFVLVVKDESGKANKDNPMYFASSINGWNPADEEAILIGRSDLRWQYVIDRDMMGVGVQFKFTLGGWDREELDSDGNPIANRSLPLVDASKLRDGERPTIELVVQDFREPQSLAEQVRKSGFYHKLEVTGDVHRLQVQGGAGGAESMTRDLQIWTPPGYNDRENHNKTYPVLYMFDGQHLFEHLPHTPGEWHADETATRLVESGMVEPMIIVGIPNSGAHRLREYLPFGSYKNIEGDGRAGMEWVVREVMPRVERAFRVRSEAGSRTIGGASLGGAMALYGSTAYPDLFSAAVIESLPMLGDDGQSAKEYMGSISQWPNRVFVGVGGKEVSNDSADEERNRSYVEWAKELDSILSENGVNSSNRLLVVEPDANHNEIAWAQRFERALLFLYSE